MEKITSDMVKKLRSKTGVGIMDCKIALESCDGDLEKSYDFLRKKGISDAVKRSDKSITEGIIQHYVHIGGKIGVLVEINCETDFVAKTDDFIKFTKNIAMHIAATNPIGITSDDVSGDIIEREKEIYKAQALEMGKPEKMIDKIIEGKINKFFKENCLMKQEYVKDTKKTIFEYLNEIIMKTGEQINIRRFIRFKMGGV